MPFNSSVRGTFGSQGKVSRSIGANNGLSSAAAFTTFTEIRTAPTSGTYWIRTSDMSQARQFYVDSVTGGFSGVRWVRIFLQSQDFYREEDTTEVDAWANSDIPALIDSAQYFMYCFVNTANNATTQAWYFGKPTQNASSFRSHPPTSRVHGFDSNPLITQITATRISDNNSVQRYMRTGASSFGSKCDDGRSSFWGTICLKTTNNDLVGVNGNTSSTNPADYGYQDFPYFASYAVQGQSAPGFRAHCSRSDQVYSTTECSSSRRFAIYLG
jgi:hypothetical protein